MRLPRSTVIPRHQTNPPNLAPMLGSNRRTASTVWRPTQSRTERRANHDNETLTLRPSRQSPKRLALQNDDGSASCSATTPMRMAPPPFPQACVMASTGMVSKRLTPPISQHPRRLAQGQVEHGALSVDRDAGCLQERNVILTWAEKGEPPVQVVSQHDALDREYLAGRSHCDLYESSEILFPPSDNRLLLIGFFICCGAQTGIEATRSSYSSR